MSKVRTDFEHRVYDDGFGTMYHHVLKHGVLSIDTAIAKCEEYQFVLLKNILEILSKDPNKFCKHTDLSPLMKKEIINYILDDIKLVDSRGLKDGEKSHDFKVYKFNPDGINKGFAGLIEHGLLLNGFNALLREREKRNYESVKSSYEFGLRLNAFRKERNIPIPENKTKPINYYSYHQIINYLEDKNEARLIRNNTKFFIRVSRYCSQPFVTLDGKENYCLVIVSPIDDKLENTLYDIIVRGYDYESYEIHNCNNAAKDRILYCIKNIDVEINIEQLRLIGFLKV